MYRIRIKNDSEHISHASETQSTSGGKQSKSKYKGGFEIKGNRLNNSKAYNHDYYLKNKDKWNKSKQPGAQKINSNILDLDLYDVISIASYEFKKFLYEGKKMVESFVDTISDWLPNFKKDNKVEPVTPKEVKEKLKEDKEKPKDFNPSDGLLSDLYKRKETKDNEHTIIAVLEDAEKVNPGYYTPSRQIYDENCAYCTLAYDFRRRGYDVTAISESDPKFVNPDLSEIETWYEKGKFTKTKYETRDREANTHALFDELAAQGDGARGFVCVYWPGGAGGHAMAYEVVDGEAMIIDTQNNCAMSAETFANSAYSDLNWGSREDAEELYATYDPLYLIAYGLTFEDYKQLCDSQCGVNYMRTDTLTPSRKGASKANSVGG